MSDKSFPQFEQYNDSSVSDVRYSTSITMDDIKDVKGEFSCSDIDRKDSLRTSTVSDHDDKDILQLANEIGYVSQSSMFESCQSHISLLLASMASEQLQALKQVMTPKFDMNNP